MTAQVKDFELAYPSGSSRRSDLFPKYPAIIDTVGREFKESTTKAPTADQVAKQIVAAVEQKSSPRKIWLGQNSFVFQYLVPYLPVWAADALWSKIMRMDMMA